MEYYEMVAMVWFIDGSCDRRVITFANKHSTTELFARLAEWIDVRLRGEANVDTVQLFSLKKINKEIVEL